MAISRQVDLLEPINLAEHLDKVELYLGQVCQIAGISKMQLDYWTNKGLNLGAAIEAARRFREKPVSEV
jgi:hypothetical protein